VPLGGCFLEDFSVDGVVFVGVGPEDLDLGLAFENLDIIEKSGLEFLVEDVRGISGVLEGSFLDTFLLEATGDDGLSLDLVLLADGVDSFSSVPEEGKRLRKVRHFKMPGVQNAWILRSSDVRSDSTSFLSAFLFLANCSCKARAWLISG